MRSICPEVSLLYGINHQLMRLFKWWKKTRYLSETLRQMIIYKNKNKCKQTENEIGKTNKYCNAILMVKQAKNYVKHIVK